MIAPGCDKFKRVPGSHPQREDLAMLSCSKNGKPDKVCVTYLQKLAAMVGDRPHEAAIFK